MLEQRSEIGTAILRMSVEAYEKALEVRDQVHFPISWARTRKNLGDAKTSLWYSEGAKLHLEEAVSTYEGAMTVLTREDFPFDWAMIQSSLGAALLRLAHIDCANSKIHYEEADAAFDEALEMWQSGDFQRFTAEANYGSFVAEKCLEDPENCPLGPSICG